MPMQRDRRVDILKGIAIILMVYGHTFPFCRNFIYLFHMPVFCIASGYCYQLKADSLSGLRKYICRRFERLYLSFILCNLVFLFSTNIMLQINFYTDNPAFKELSGTTPYVQNLYSSMSFPAMLKKIPQIILLRWLPPNNVASWFLPELFIVIFIHSLIEYIIRDKGGKAKRVVRIALIILMFLISLYISITNASIENIVRRYPAMYFSFLIGIFLKNFPQREKLYKLPFAVTSFVMLIILSFSQKVELAAGIINGLWYPICCICGWMFLMWISNIINQAVGKAGNVIAYIGRHTIPIVILHLISFKVVTLLYIGLKALPIFMLASFPVLFDTGEWIKIIYTMVGVFVPLLIYWLFEVSKERMLVLIRP